MARPVSGKISTDEVRVKQKNGDIYVYERQTKYDPAVGDTINLSCKLIGKIPAGTSEMVRTRAKKSYGSSAKAAKTGSPEGKSPAGLSDILDWIGEKSGIDHDLGMVFGEETCALLIALARMRLTEGRFSFSDFERWQMHHGSPLGNQVVTEVMWRDFFDKLGEEQDFLFMRYFRARAARCSSEKLAAMDTADMPEEREGEEADDMSLLRLLTVCSMRSGQPVAFVRLHDELKETAVLEKGFEDLGDLDIWREARGAFLRAVQRATPGSFPVVTDRGLYDAGNVALYMEQDISFISGIILYTPWVYEAFEAHRHELEKADSFFLDNRLYKACTVIAEPDFSSEEGRDASVSSMEKKGGRLYLHFYFDSLGCSNEKAALHFWIDEMTQMIQNGLSFPEEAGSMAERLLIVSKGKNKSVQCNEKALIEEQKDYGIFCLASNTVADPREALRYCLERNTISAFFHHKKHTIFEEICTPSRSLQENDGYLFARFVALGYCTYFQEALQRVIARLSRQDSADSEADRALKDDLKDWLCESSPEEVLDLFDCIESLRHRPSRKADSVWNEQDRKDEERARLLEALLREEAPCL